MAQLALDKADSPRVKSYARKLLSDHQAADKRLMAYAERKTPEGARPEPRTTGTTPATTEAHARLHTLSGAEFDREFVNVMLDEHDKAIELVKNARDTASDKQLKNIYGSMLPKLEQHRKVARDLADKLVKS
jgi:putative membrane protein